MQGYNERCPKVFFDTRKEAAQRLNLIHRCGEKRDKTPKRVYQCEKCGKWHLTSFSVAKKKAVDYAKLPEVRLVKRINKVAMKWAAKKGWDID